MKFYLLTAVSFLGNWILSVGCWILDILLVFHSLFDVAQLLKEMILLILNVKCFRLVAGSMLDVLYCPSLEIGY